MIIPIELRFKADKGSKSAFRTEKTIKSHDRNSIEFHITIDGLELTGNHTAKILSLFHSSESQVNVDCEIIEGKIIYKPDTNLITRHEHVTSYVYVYHNNQSFDVREFIYIVDLSKIDETSLEVKEVYDQSYADLLADFEQALEDYKLTLPQADSVRADIDEILNQFSEDSQAMLSLVNEAESLRVEAEGNRDSAETSRVQAEAQREVKETSRVEAETQRVSAELSRVSAEEQRKIDHANRSAELDGKADKVVIKNLVENGDFSKDFNGWEVKGNVQNINGRVKLVRMTGNSLASLSYQDREIFASRNDVYYMTVKGELVNRISGGDGIMINDTVNVLPVWMLRSQPKGVVSNSSIVFNLSPNNTPYVYANTTEGSEYFIDHIIIVNLTDTFGPGNEPTKEEMDRLIEITGYIDSEYALNNKEMLGHLMKDIRVKANKKQEDWRTPMMLNGATGSLQYRKDEFGVVHFKGDINAPATSAFTQLVSLPPSHSIYESRYIPVALNAYFSELALALRFTSTGIFINGREANTYNLDNTHYSTN